MSSPTKSFLARRPVTLLMLLYLVMSGLWYWRLHPQPEEAGAKRTKHMASVAAYLSKAPREVSSSMIPGLAFASEDRLDALHQWIERPELDQLRQLTVQNQPEFSAPGMRDGLLLAWLNHPHQTSPLEAHLLIMAAGDRLDEQIKLHALEHLAKQAQAAGQMSVAIMILERACSFESVAWPMVLRLTDLCAAAGESATGLRTVRRWLARHRSNDRIATTVEAAKEVELDLMLRLGQAAEALSAQLHILHAAPADALPAAVLSRALVCARATAAEKRLLPWIDQFLNGFAEHQLDWRALLAKADIDSDYRQWLRHRAAIFDRQSSAADRFAAYLRLAAAGERAAMPLVCRLALEPGCRTEADAFLAKALDHLVLRLAVLQEAEVDPLARRALAKVLKARPKDRDLHFAASLAKAAAASTNGAALVWQEFLRRFPDDPAAERRLAQAYVEAGESQMALRAMSRIHPGTETAADEEQKRLLQGL